MLNLLMWIGRRRLALALLAYGAIALLVTGTALGQTPGDEIVAPDALNERLAMWNAIAGFLSPLALAVIIQTGWSRSVQAVLAFVFCLGLSVATTALEAGLNWQDWITSMLVIFTATIASYKGFWQPTGVAGSLESATTPGRR